ncbi:hypothetical protein GCM10011611_17270 [Aliidongia dinghuensis]|uniref:Uncharacterized protein n=2 Tax=Aliidongia dinghuensis TaxID=1867774 RepID=A0A8J3E2M3_9PROT|nr:hypothetical protein GCM10011611_17270 [Aliidongia dinghuensis]
MNSKGSTSAVSPAQSDTQPSADTGSAPSSQKATHKTHHAKPTGSSKTSGSKSTDHDADMLNQQELGKIQSPKS